MDLSSVPTGMLVLAGIALVVAAFCHWYLRGFWRASLVSAVATPAVFLLASIVQERGVPDPLTGEALALFVGLCLLVHALLPAVRARGLGRRRYHLLLGCTYLSGLGGSAWYRPVPRCSMAA